MSLIPDYQDLVALCVRILQQLSRQHPDLGLSDEQVPGLAHRTASILSENLTNGRFSYVCTQGHLAGTDTDEERLFNYAAKVCIIYLQERSFIASLQAGEEEAWQRVLQRLVKLAYNKCIENGARDWALREAQILASETCFQLWQRLQSHSYPFDVPFDQWSACALNHRFIDWWRNLQRHALHYTCSLDEPTRPGGESNVTWGDILLVDETVTQWLENHANREWLLQSIEGLRNPLERRVIRLRYLEERSTSEIAEELGIAINYVHVLQHRALAHLRGILKNGERFRP